MSKEIDFWNRGNNLAIVAFLGAVALGVLGEVIMEKELIDKLDDALIVILGIIAIVWYLKKNNKFKFSYTPFILISLTFLIKVIALIIEFDDKESVGDEFGLLLPLLAMVIIAWVLLSKSKKMNKKKKQMIINRQFIYYCCY